MIGNVHPLDEVPASSLDISDATWMDDLSMFVLSDSAEKLLGDLTKGASILIDACLQRALLPNLSRGKTEAMMQLHGKGARKARHNAFGEREGSLPLDCRLWPQARLKLVPAYKHLGGFLQHGGGLRQELAFRTAQAWDAFNRRKKKVFRSPLVSLTDKATIFQSLIITVLFHGAGTWTRVEDCHLSALDSTLRQMACQMLAPEVCLSEAWHIGLTQVLAKVGLPRAETHLHIARLRHLLACVSLQIPEIWALAHWEGAWLASIRASLEWLWGHTDGGKCFPNWYSAWEVWREDCRLHPGRWKSRLRRATQHALQCESWQACCEQHAGLLVRQATRLGAVLPLDLMPERCAAEVCAVCKVVFKDFQAWSVHAFKRHGRIRESRILAEGRQCPGCLRHYASNIRLCRHLHHSEPCRRFLNGHRERVTPQPGQGSKRAPKEYLLCAPTLQAHGPFPVPAGDEIDDELGRPSAEVLDCLSFLNYDGSSLELQPVEAWERIRTAFSCVCLPLKRLRLTAEVWQDQLAARQTADGTEDPGIAFLRHASKWVSNVDFAEWLAPEAADRKTPLSTFRQGVTTLSVLEVDRIRLPDPAAWSADHVLVCVGPPPPIPFVESLCKASLIYAHEDSIDRISRGEELDFLAHEPEQCGFCFNLSGLPLPFTPAGHGTEKACQTLRALNLACDLLRLALRCWAKGVPACLTLPLPLGDDVRFLSRISGVRSFQADDRVTLWVGPANSCHRLFHLL